MQTPTNDPVGCPYRYTGKLGTLFCRLGQHHAGPHHDFLGTPTDKDAMWLPPGIVDYGVYGKDIKPGNPKGSE